MRIAWMICVLAFLCSHVAAESETDGIRQMMEMQANAWNRGDMAAFVKPYDATGLMVFITPEGPVRTPEALQQRYEKRYGSAGKDFGKLTFSEIQVDVLSKGLARAYGKWSVAQGEKTSTGWFSLLLQKQGNGWRIIHDHSS